jgi:hypothetical protein
MCVWCLEPLNKLKKKCSWGLKAMNRLKSNMYISSFV